MSFINGLDGTVATLLLCALLFIDEAGVPLPFAPNEVLLLIAGLLIGNGSLAPLVFIPLAYLTMVGGMLTAYSWARAIGSARLRSVAARVKAEKTYDRAIARIHRGGAPAVCLTRILPGVRIYATLVAGATELDIRTFLAGALPALALWCAVLIALGVAVGLPAEHFLNRFENLAVTGAVLVGSAVAAALAIRRIPPRVAEGDNVLLSAPPWERLVLALALDLGIILTLVVGVDRLARSALRTLRFDGPVEVAVVVASVIVGYVAATRRGPGTTAGEGLFDVSYRSRR